MARRILAAINRPERDFFLFLLVSVFLGIGQSVDGSTLSNFLKEKFNMTITQRSALEIPRELPGFLVFLVIGILYTLGDIRIAVLANLCAALGMFLLGVIPTEYIIIVITIFIYSMGQHIYLPLSNSIGMSFASDGRFGRMLGRVNAVNTVALVVSSALLWILFKFARISFTVSFSIGAAAFLAAAVTLGFINPKQTVRMANRFVFKKEYSLYYWLSALYGARKQIIITFGPWVLVDVFRQKVTTMTALFFIASVLSIFFKPLVGFLIDCIGEKYVLGGEAAALFFVCLGYTFAGDLLPQDVAVIVVSSCYILDRVMDAVTMARATYLKRIVVKEEDLSPTLSTGISIDHLIAMFLPSLGGYIWHVNGINGYKYVFLGGALIAIVNLISTSQIRLAGSRPLEGKDKGSSNEIDIV